MSTQRDVCMMKPDFFYSHLQLLIGEHDCNIVIPGSLVANDMDLGLQEVLSSSPDNLISDILLDTSFS